jgi:hypothetical protein
VACFVTPPLEAETVTLVLVLTLPVCTAKVAALAPAGIVTLVGTVATEVLLLRRLTCTPPVGAGPLSVTVPCDEPPDRTVLGARLSDAKDAVDGGGDTVVGCTVRVADTIAPE